MEIASALCLFLLSGVGCVADTCPLQVRINAAAPGDTVVVQSGTHEGALVIDRAINLVGEGRPVIQGTGRGCVVRILAPGVVLRGFRITGSGLALMADDAAVFVAADRAVIEDNEIDDSLHGIYLKKVNDCRILHNRIRGKTHLDRSEDSIERGLGSSVENCDQTALVANRRGNGIHLWNCERIELSTNEISEARDGIYFSFANHCRAAGNQIHHVRYGLHYMYSNDNTFTANIFSDNAAGAALMFSERLVVSGNYFVSNWGFRAYGIILQSVDDSRFEDNRVEQNAVGLSLNQCNRDRFTGNQIGRNYIGLRFGGNSDDNAFALNVFTGNLHPVEMTGDSGTNRWAVAKVGNQWEAATVLDLDGDGINDLPHRELDLFGVLRRDFPPVALLSESPLIKLLRFAHERAALPGLNSIQDPAPLTSHYWDRASVAGGGRSPIALNRKVGMGQPGKRVP